METKKLKSARKLVEGAVSTFGKAVAEIEKANDLLVQSKNHDVALIESYEAQIKALYAGIDQIQAVVADKERSIKANADLILRLSEFTV